MTVYPKETQRIGSSKHHRQIVEINVWQSYGIWSQQTKLNYISMLGNGQLDNKIVTDK